MKTNLQISESIPEKHVGNFGKGNKNKLTWRFLIWAEGASRGGRNITSKEIFPNNVSIS